MNTRNDLQIKQFLKSSKGEYRSEQFSDGVMRRLPHREPLPLWRYALVIALWLLMGVWIAFSFDEMIRGIQVLFMNLGEMRMPGTSQWLIYPAFLMLLGIVIWETVNIFLYKFDRVK